MKTLKRSRAAKIIAFILIVLFVLASGLNAAGLYLAYRENLMNVSREAFNKKVYSFFAEQTANDAIRYFYTVNDRDEKGNAAYFDSEAELYRSKFSRENSRAAFVIKDENGKELLKNFDEENPVYQFDRTFVYNTVEYDEGFYSWEETATVRAPEQEAVQPSAAAQHKAEQATVMEEAQTWMPDAEPTATEPETSAEAQTTVPAENSEAEPTTPSAMPTEADTTSTYPGDIEFYIMPGEREDGMRFRYAYRPSEGVNDTILDYCSRLFLEDGDTYGHFYAEGVFDGNVVYFQDEFAVSANGVPYYVGEGSLHKMVEHQIDPGRYQKTYTVSVIIGGNKQPHDVYRLADALSEFAYNYKNAALPLTILFIALGIALYVFLLWAAGWTKTAEGPVCRGWHRVPFDVSLAVFFILMLILGAIITDALSSSYDLPILVAVLLPAAAILTVCFTESLAVRLRTRSIKESLLVAKLFRLLKKGAGVISQNLNVLWKAGIWYVASGIVCCLLIFILHDNAEILLILYILLKLAEIPLIVICALNFHTLREGAKRLAQGKLGEKVESALFFGEFKKHANDLNDINTGINRAVEERMKSESMKTELITNVSHDLKTPLTSIVNYIDLLKKEEIENPKAQEYIDVIDRQSQRLKKLTTDIVEASKAATGSIPMQMERVDLGVLMHQVCGEYSEKLAAKQLQPLVSLPEAPTAILADGRLLWRVFDNLMNNVCKYAMPGTRVYLSLQNDGNNAYAVFRNVSESELNISPEELTERFVRGDASRNTEGSGLGLAISKSLTQNMGGSFNVEIDGDLFKVTLVFPVFHETGVSK